MTDAQNITMTPEELNALVETRIAERDAKRELEARRLYELYNPPPTPAPARREASPELMAEFNSALDAANGDVEKATARIAGMLSKDVQDRPAYPQFYALYMQWGGNLRGLLQIMMRRRERQEAGV
jgi:hypothetical protein